MSRSESISHLKLTSDALRFVCYCKKHYTDTSICAFSNFGRP